MYSKNSIGIPKFFIVVI